MPSRGVVDSVRSGLMAADPMSDPLCLALMLTDLDFF